MTPTKYSEWIDHIFDTYYAPIKLPDSNRKLLKQAILIATKELIADIIGQDVKESDYVLNMVLKHNPPSNTTRTNLTRKGYNTAKQEARQRMEQLLK